MVGAGAGSKKGRGVRHEGKSVGVQPVTMSLGFVRDKMLDV